jgi:hypothetical protein
MRLYEAHRLRYILRHVPDDCLVDAPTWGPSVPYFRFADTDYSFCSIAFRKRLRCTPSETFAENPLAVQLRDARENYRQLAAINDRFDAVKEAGPVTLKLTGTLHRFLKRVPFKGAVKRGMRSVLRGNRVA